MPDALPSRSLTLAFMIALALATPASGLEQDCAGTGGLAATLLIPYFEVDLDQPSGRTTLFSVANAGPEATVARVVLWTDLGLPTLGFDVLVRADGVVSVNLRDVFGGRLPVTGIDPWDKADSCGVPLALPDLSGTALADLRARHTGLPSSDGLCFGAHQEDGPATGYITVDVMEGCLPVGRVPADGEPYFAGEGGLAAERNVLWGDFFLVDAAGQRAEGLRAVPIPADSTIRSAPTFYGSFAPEGADRRLPLRSLHRFRFLDGLDSDTDLIVWSGPLGKVPLPPYQGQCIASGNDPVHFIRGWDETAAESIDAHLVTDRHALRIAVGSEKVPAPIPSGTLELESYVHCHDCSTPFGGPHQAWVGALTRAQGHFAVGLEAVALGSCR